MMLTENGHKISLTLFQFVLKECFKSLFYTDIHFGYIH